MTLQFRNAELERRYYPFVNENSVPYVCLGYTLTAIIFLVYIALDTRYPYICVALSRLLFLSSFLPSYLLFFPLLYSLIHGSYDAYSKLLIVRLITAAIFLFSLALILFVKAVRRHSVHVSTVICSVVYISCLLGMPPLHASPPSLPSTHVLPQ